MDAVSSQVHMEGLAAFLDGEQLISILLGVLLAVVVGFSICSWFIVRRLKSRLGRRAYLLATIPFVLTAIAAFAEMRREAPNEG